MQVALSSPTSAPGEQQQELTSSTQARSTGAHAYLSFLLLRCSYGMFFSRAEDPVIEGTQHSCPGCVSLVLAALHASLTRTSFHACSR